MIILFLDVIKLILNARYKDLLTFGDLTDNIFFNLVSKLVVKE